MKTVFISASPVLVNEVSRFYKNLKNALIAHLIKKENNGEKRTEKEIENSKNFLINLINNL